MTGATPPDRRQRRRQETIEQVLDVAADVMAEAGVAGLTLGEVARRMGIRPPSLYVYFGSKNALYDALFRRGWQELLAVTQAAGDAFGRDDPAGDVLAYNVALVRWAVGHPGYAPLMFWRPVPGFVPSEEAYRPAVALARHARTLLADLQRRGGLRADADLDLAFGTLTVLTSGVIGQQLSNAPGEPFETGTFTSALPVLTGMWLSHFAPPGVHPPS